MSLAFTEPFPASRRQLLHNHAATEARHLVAKPVLLYPFVVKVSDGGDVSQLTAAAPAPAPAPASAPAAAAPAGAGTPVTAPLAGTIWKVLASEGQTVAAGEVLLILEAMKMETEIRAAQAGTVRGIAVKAGDAVAVGDTLMTLA